MCERMGAFDGGNDAFVPGKQEERFDGFFADTELEVAYHEREGVRTGSGAYAVNGVVLFFGIRHESCIDGLFYGYLCGCKVESWQHRRDSEALHIYRIVIEEDGSMNIVWRFEDIFAE